MSNAALIWAPFADSESAEVVATALLDRRLIACANILPAIRSVFRWDGECQSAQEVACLFKTDTVLLDQAVAALEVLHPYDEPAIIGWHADAAAPATLGWLARTLETS